MAAQRLASGDTSFALAFYGPAVTATGAGQDMIVSPYSVSAALTMVDVGAAGETATQMQTVLHLPGAGADVAPAYAALACEDEVVSIDQPFLFLIRDTKNGSILFMGRVADPRQGS